jgi:hypothetical protein
LLLRAVQLIYREKKKKKETNASHSPSKYFWLEGRNNNLIVAITNTHVSGAKVTWHCKSPFRFSFFFILLKKQ